MTSSTRHEAQISADPDVPLIRITREFDASPEKVYRAHVDPDLVKQWMGPDSTQTRIDSWDARSGGSWRYTAIHEGQEYGFHGCFHELRPGELIVQTFTFDGMPDGVALEKLVLEDLGNGRTRLTATSLVDSFEGRDGFLSSGMDVGVNEGYAKLDALLARS